VPDEVGNIRRIGAVTSFATLRRSGLPARALHDRGPACL